MPTMLWFSQAAVELNLPRLTLCFPSQMAILWKTLYYPGKMRMPSTLLMSCTSLSSPTWGGQLLARRCISTQVGQNPSFSPVSCPFYTTKTLPGICFWSLQLAPSIPIPVVLNTSFSSTDKALVANGLPLQMENKCGRLGQAHTTLQLETIPALHRASLSPSICLLPENIPCEMSKAGGG